MPVKNNREYRIAQPFTARALGEEEKSYIVEGYACTFDDPYVLWEYDGIEYKEQIDRNAFDECDMSDVIFQYDHMGMVYARNKNGTLKLEIDDHGLKVIADLGSTEESRKIYEAIDAGLVTEMSFAFTVVADAYDNKEHLRTIQKIGKLYDVSAVSIPANPGTDIHARSFFEGVIEEERRESARAKEMELRKRKILLMMEVEE